MSIGIGLGILIGIVTGTALLLLLRAATVGTPSLATATQIIAELLAIPTFWFGGPWVTTTLLRDLQPGDILLDYITALSITFGLIAVAALVALIIRTVLDIGKRD